MYNVRSGPRPDGEPRLLTQTRHETVDAALREARLHEAAGYEAIVFDDHGREWTVRNLERAGLTTAGGSDTM